MLFIATVVVVKFLSEGSKAFIVTPSSNNVEDQLKAMAQMIEELKEEKKAAEQFEQDTADFADDFIEFEQDMREAARIDDEDVITVDGDYEEVEDVQEEEPTPVSVEGEMVTTLTVPVDDSVLDLVEDLDIVEEEVVEQYNPYADIPNYDLLVSHKKACERFAKDSAGRKRYWSMLTGEIALREKRKFLNLSENYEFSKEIQNTYRVTEDIGPTHPMYQTVLTLTRKFNQGRDQSTFMEAMAQLQPYAVPIEAVEIDNTIVIEFLV